MILAFAALESRFMTFGFAEIWALAVLVLGGAFACLAAIAALRSFSRPPAPASVLPLDVNLHQHLHLTQIAHIHAARVGKLD